MLKWLKLSHPRHSGRLRPHEHTSYAPLAILLFIVGIALTGFTAYAAHPAPEAASVSLSGVVPGKPPTIAATITTPSDQQHFTVTPITVAGSCPANTLVELYKNDIFAGSTACSDKGVYTLQIDLLIGQNALIARVYDALNQAGPDSRTVTVFYDAVLPQGATLTSLGFGGAQLVLNTDAVFRGVFPNQTLTVPITILGGTAPYAFNVQWGDSTNNVVPRGDGSIFNISHVYAAAGTYQVSMQATDSTGRVGFLTVAAIVNGQPAVAAGSTDTTSSDTTSKLLALWPLYASTVAVMISFWLGERREKHILATNKIPYSTLSSNKSI